MITKITPEELKKLTDLLGLKDTMYSQIFELINRAEHIAAAIFVSQRELEKKYDVDLTSKNTRLNLKTGDIEEIILATKDDKIVDIKDLRQGK